MRRLNTSRDREGAVVCTRLAGLNAVLLLFALLLVGGCGEATVEPTPHEAEQTTGEADEAGGPGDAVRRLLVAVLLRDEQAVRASALPHENLHALWAGEPPEEERAKPFRRMLEQEMTTRQLQPGETVALPGSQQHVLSEEVLTDDRQLVIAEREGETLMAPLWVERTEEGWRVDAGPLIAAEMMRQQ
ncbi:MAG: hypothetical protein WD294_00615 [Phycisphaeraceae bacterium]